MVHHKKNLKLLSDTTYWYTCIICMYHHVCIIPSLLFSLFCLIWYELWSSLFTYFIFPINQLCLGKNLLTYLTFRCIFLLLLSLSASYSSICYNSIFGQIFLLIVAADVWFINHILIFPLPQYLIAVDITASYLPTSLLIAIIELALSKTSSWIHWRVTTISIISKSF